MRLSRVLSLSKAPGPVPLTTGKLICDGAVNSITNVVAGRAIARYDAGKHSTEV